MTLDNVSATEIRGLAEQGQQWLQENAETSMHSVGSSAAVMFANISKIAITSMLRGMPLALILISGLLVIAFRNLRMGLLSLIPNLIPIAMGFGVWAIFNGQIGMGLSAVMGMTFGVVVDDTIHFLSKYLRARREKGLSSPEAVRFAFSSVGTAILVTSVILIIGFGILLCPLSV